MRIIALTAFLMVLFSFGAIAQQGSVNIVQPQEMDSLLVRDMNWHTGNPEWEGYRIQIYFEAGNNSKRRAQDVIEGFVMEFNDTPAYLSFKEPYYRVRVGDFHTRLQAAAAIKEISKIYSGAFIVRESINPEIPSFQELNPPEEDKIDPETKNIEP